MKNIMAAIIYFAIVLLSVQYVAGRECFVVNNIKNCNECIRCGGHWCSNLPRGATHCTPEPNLNCTDDEPTLERIKFVALPGKAISNTRFKTNAIVGEKSLLQVQHNSHIVPKVSSKVVSSTTKSSDFSVETTTHCSNMNCTTTVEATARKNFCRSSSGVSEFVTVHIHIETYAEIVEIQYHVPCACKCSQASVSMADACHKHGHYICGTCTCRGNWKGEFCDEPTICPMDRGDVTCTNPANNLDCSGNGYCGGPCQSCECFTDRPGSQYFDKHNYCSDLCLTIGQYCADECLRDSVVGEKCDECPYLVFTHYNETELSTLDYLGRNNWVHCNETVGDCNIEYSAMVNDDDETLVMLSSLCDESVVGAAPAIREAVSVTVPVVLTVVGMVAAAAAVAGYMFYKSRTPPLPLMDPHYQNIGAEDCTGVNPLYKPPTSSFINPTYRK